MAKSAREIAEEAKRSLIRDLTQKYGLGKFAPKVDRRSGITDADDWIKSGKWIYVISSNVKRIRYDRPRMVMWVEFKGGGVYSCSSFPVAQAKKYFYAKSMGKHHWSLRRAGYNFIKQG